MAAVNYSRGKRRTALTVDQMSATSEDEFTDAILADIAEAKYKQFFCAPMCRGPHPKAADNPEKYAGEKFWRLAVHAQPWRVARFDCDGFDSPRTFEDLKDYLTKFKGFLYTTSNHTPDNPRCRFVVFLDKEVNRDEGIRVCRAIEAEIDAHIRSLAELIDGRVAAITWDDSVYRAEQQCYTPVNPVSGQKAVTLRFQGDLADVSHYLGVMPEARRSEKERCRPLNSNGAVTTITTNDRSEQWEQWEQWEGIDRHTMEDLRGALFSPGMLKISAGARNPWQAVIARLSYLKGTPLEDKAYQLALEWSEAGGAIFDLDDFIQTWESSRADLTSYKAIFSEAQRAGWENPQVMRPFLERDKTGFYMTGDGLMENIEVGKGNAKQIVARKISSPFTIRGRTRDAYGDNWGRLVEFRDFDGEARHYVVPDEQLHKPGSEIPQRLASMGLWINSGMAKQLLTYLNMVPATARLTCTDRTGWHNASVFVLPDKSVGKDAGAVIYQHRGREKCQLAQSGTIEEWQQNISAKCEGNSRLVFSVCVSLAAPLMALTGMDGGVFSLLGASTKGKSTAQHIAASVWGKGATAGGYARTWNTSLVGLEVMAATHNDLPLVLDELKSVPAKIVGSAAYMLAMGRGKERGTKDIGLRDTLQWRTLVLASSERPFSSYLAAAGETMEAGQQARFVDIPAVVNEKTGLFSNLHGSELTEEAAKRFADDLNRLSARFYGTAGMAWLAYITRADRSALLESVEGVRGVFRDKYRPDGAGAQLDRVMERFTLCAVAGELATRAGITGWKEGEALDGVGCCFLDYVRQRGTLHDLEGMNGVEYLRQYLGANGCTTFMRESRDRPRPHDGYIAPADGGSSVFTNLDEPIPPGREGDDRREVYWIFPEAMDRILTNHNKEATLATLAEMGALVTGKRADGKTDYNPRKYDPVFNQRRHFYRIIADVLFS